MSELPKPLTPSNCDLRSFDWFPFFHKRLRQSSFWKRASDLACRISVDFWSEAYEQVPAASVPDDDHLLAEWAGFGRRDIGGWLAVKGEVMSAWVRCADHRWYHPTLSEVACESFVKHRVHAWSRECDRLRKENAKRAKTGEPPIEMPPRPSDDAFSEVGGAGTPPKILPDRAQSGGNDELSAGLPAEEGRFPAENPLTRTRTRTLKETRASALPFDEALPDESKPRSRPSAPRKHPYPPDAFDRWYSGYPHKVGRAAAEKAFAKVRTSDEVDFERLVAAVERYRRSKPPDHAWCNPATWLNQARWADEPATSLMAAASGGGDEPRVDFGNGIKAPHSTIRGTWGRGRWPNDWGPRPDQPGCLIPADTMTRIMGERHAA